MATPQSDQWCSLLAHLKDYDLLYHVAPASSRETLDWTSSINQVLASPTNSAPVGSRVNSGSKVVVLVDDITRPTPQRTILPHLLNHFNKAGVADSDITILIALGTHRYMSRAEMRDRLGQKVCGRVDVFNHTWRDESSLVEIGELSNGRKLEINRIAAEADFLIGVGSIVPHIWAGWGGGAKILLPGISSADSIAPTHSMAEREADLLNVSGHASNACRREIERASELAGLDMVLNCVIDDKGQAAWIGAGEPVTTHREGVAVAEKLFMQTIPEKADIAIADARPATKDYWQGVKALAHAARGVRNGGVIVLTGSFPNGISSTHPEFSHFSRLSPAGVAKHAQKGDIQDRVIVTTLKLHTTILDRYEVICLSAGLSEDAKHALGFRHADTAAEALNMARGSVGTDAKIGIIEYAGNVLTDSSGGTVYNRE